MLKRSFTLTTSAALALGLAAVAQASITTRASDPAPAGRLDAYQAYVENGTPAPVTRSLSGALRSDASDRSQAGQTAPRVVALPGADAPNQGYASSTPDAGRSTGGAERLPQARPMSGSQAPDAQVPPRSAERAIPPKVAKAPPSASGPLRTNAYRTAKWSDGEGSSWKTGRDAYGFSGMLGGCRIHGTAGPRGYSLNRAC